MDDTGLAEWTLGGLGGHRTIRDGRDLRDHLVQPQQRADLGSEKRKHTLGCHEKRGKAWVLGLGLSTSHHPHPHEHTP